jgi:hypothetical protein
MSGMPQAGTALEKYELASTFKNVTVERYLLARRFSSKTIIKPIFKCESGTDAALELDDELRDACIRYRDLANGGTAMLVTECPLLLACATGKGHATLVIVFGNELYGFGMLMTGKEYKLPEEGELCSFMSPDPIFKPFTDTKAMIKAIIPFSLNIADIFRTRLQSRLEETACSSTIVKIITNIPYVLYRSPFSAGDNCASFAEIIPSLEAGYYGFSNPRSMHSENGGAIFLALLDESDIVPEEFMQSQECEKPGGCVAFGKPKTKTLKQRKLEQKKREKRRKDSKKRKRSRKRKSRR